MYLYVLPPGQGYITHDDFLLSMTTRGEKLPGSVIDNMLQVGCDDLDFYDGREDLDDFDHNDHIDDYVPHDDEWEKLPGSVLDNILLLDCI